MRGLGKISGLARFSRPVVAGSERRCVVEVLEGRALFSAVYGLELFSETTAPGVTASWTASKAMAVQAAAPYATPPVAAITSNTLTLTGLSTGFHNYDVSMTIVSATAGTMNSDPVDYSDIDELEVSVQGTSPGVMHTFNGTQDVGGYEEWDLDLQFHAGTTMTIAFIGHSYDTSGTGGDDQDFAEITLMGVEDLGGSAPAAAAGRSATKTMALQSEPTHPTAFSVSSSPGRGQSRSMIHTLLGSVAADNNVPEIASPLTRRSPLDS